MHAAHSARSRSEFQANNPEHPLGIALPTVCSRADAYLRTGQGKRDRQRRAAGVSAAAAAGHGSEEDVDETYDIGRCGVLFHITSSDPAAGTLRFLQESNN